jgi:TP901 family phage tail tape measure protein
VPERNTKINVGAQGAQYIATFRQMARVTRETGTELEKLNQKKESFQLLGRSFLGAGLALGAGLTVAIAKASEFDQSMSYVQAATHETADGWGALRSAALEAGASTVFSATESANAIEELGKAGIGTRDILTGGLNGSLDLAAAGGLGVAEAAGIASTSLKTFNLEGSQTSHVADLLAAGAGKAMGDVTDLGSALGQAGQVAHGTGLNIEETTAGLAAFASQGLLGSDAGTAFKSMLQRLTPQSAEAKSKMDELGISAYDASGNFIGLAEFAGNLRSSLKDLTPEQRNAAEAVIFGSDAVRAANVLYSEGQKGIADWEKKVNDAGYASETAAIRLDNLRGDVEQLTGAVDTGLIQAGSAANDTLRFLTQSATDLVDGFNGLPQPAQGAGLAIGGVGTAATIAAGAFFLGVPKLAEYRDAIEQMGPAAQRTSRILGAVTKGGAIAAGVIVGIDLLNNLLEKLQATQQELTNTAVTADDADALITKSLQGIAQNPADIISGASGLDHFQERLSNLADTSENWWATWAHGADGTTDLNVGLQKLGTTLGDLASSDLQAAQRAFGLLVDKTDGSDRQINELLNRMPAFKDALTAQATALGLNADQETLVALGLGEIGPKSTTAAKGLDDVSSAADTATTTVEGLADGIRDYGKATSDLTSANSDFYQSVDDARALFGAEGFAASLDLTTQAGRDNSAALRDIADAANNAAAQTYETTYSQDDLIAKLGEGRQALYDQARQFFDSDQAAWDYVDTLMQTPEQVTTTVNLNGVDEADQAMLTFLQKWDGITITADLFLDSSGGDKGLAASAARYTAQAQAYYENENQNGNIYAYENGGFPPGIYSGGPLYKFAEQNVPWEAFISGKAGMEDRNREIALDALSRLGPGRYASSSSSTSNSRSFTYSPTIQAAPDMDVYAFSRSTLALANFQEKVHGG